jgi:hypothetical protein
MESPITCKKKITIIAIPIDEVLNKIHMKNEFFTGCNPRLRRVYLIWALYLSLLVVRLDQ